MTNIYRICATCLLFLAASPNDAATRYVSELGSNTGSCDSMATACASINYAIDQSEADDTILVGRGTVGTGVFQGPVVVDKAVAIEGRQIQLFPNAWVPCQAEQCPAISGNGGVGVVVTTDIEASISHFQFTDNQGGTSVSVADGTLTLSDCVIADNTSVSGAGARVGINGNLVMERCVAERNVAEIGGGVLEVNGRATVRDSVFRLNATFGAGGAIYALNASQLTLENSQLLNNAADSGGALAAFGAGVTVRNSVVANNNASRRGGGVLLSDSSTLIETTQIVDNRIDADEQAPEVSGGAVHQNEGLLEINDSTIADNLIAPTSVLAFGGQLSAADSMQGTALIVRRSTIDQSDGAGKAVAAVTAEGFGAQITLRSTLVKGALQAGVPNNLGSEILLIDSTVQASQAPFAVYDDNQLTAYNSTLEGGGAANQFMGGRTQLIHSTAVTNVSGGSLSVFNSLLSGTCDKVTVEQASASLFDDASCAAQAVSDLGLLPLGDYGGLTPTRYLRADSPAIDAAGLADCLAAPISQLDQRGLPRAIGAACDIGAVEYDGAPPRGEVLFSESFETI